MADSIRVLGIIAIVYGALILVLSLILGLFAASSLTYISRWVAMPGLGDFTIQGASIIVATILILMAGVGVLWLLGGIGLIYHANWGRVLLIIASIISLLNFPIGTALGIIYLVFMFRNDIERKMR
jgi:hypothetical protein